MDSVRSSSCKQALRNIDVNPSLSCQPTIKVLIEVGYPIFPKVARTPAGGASAGEVEIGVAGKRVTVS